MTKIIKEFSELSTAIKDKNNDINSIVWKEKYGKEVRLVDMDYNQLQKAYNHTLSMLYNENRFTPGQFQFVYLVIVIYLYSLVSGNSRFWNT